ncbi:hypothetical protein CANARDRAFT_217426, partial [[Candida] arabinofermentans NRRL YB-2248]
MARQNFIGFVISQGKMEKTIKVRVLQKVFNKKLQKEYFRRKDYLVHDEASICREGDLVRIEATRPLSARKSFAVAEIKRNKGQQFAKYESQAKLKVIEEENAKSIEFLNRRELNSNNVNESLYSDLKDLSILKQNEELQNEEIERIKKLKEKYGITNWDEEFENKELLVSDITYLTSKIENLKLDLEISEKLNDLLSNEDSIAFKTVAEKM